MACANWTYVIWGALHTVYILTYMFSKNHIKFKFPESKILNLIYGLFTFGIVAFAWIFFRANNFADALLIIKHIFGLFHAEPFKLVVINLATKTEFSITDIVISILMIGLLLISELKLAVNLIDLNKKPVFDIVFCTSILTLIIVFGVFHNTSFIYFQF